MFLSLFSLFIYILREMISVNSLVRDSVVMCGETRKEPSLCLTPCPAPVTFHFCFLTFFLRLRPERVDRWKIACVYLEGYGGTSPRQCKEDWQERLGEREREIGTSLLSHLANVYDGRALHQGYTRTEARDHRGLTAVCVYA